MEATESLTRMFRLGVSFCTVTILSVLTNQLHCSAQPSQSPATAGNIEILSARQLTGAHYEVTIAYDFPNTKLVWLRGIGTLPAQGKLTYITLGREIEFRTAKDGALLGSRGIANYAQVPETGDLYPPTTKFGPPELPNLQLPLAPPQAKAFVMNTLAKSENLMRLAFTECRPDDEECILSQWTPITNPDEHIQAQVSVMLTYATDSSNRRATVVKVFYVGRQAYRGGSEWSSSLNEPIRSLVQGRVAKMRETILGNLPK